MKGMGIDRHAWPALVAALVVASCSSPSATSTSSPQPSASASGSLVAAASGSPAALASPGGALPAAAGGSSASPIAAASASGSASASPYAGASAPPGGGAASPAAAASAGACTPAATALAAEKAKITDAYAHDYAQAESFRSQQSGAGSMIDDVEAKLAAARDAGLAAVTAAAGTGCLDAQALAALDTATAAQVSTIDAVMPQSGTPSGSGSPTGGGGPGGGGSPAQGLPPCLGNALLDHAPTSDVASIEPLGHTYGEHIVPVQADHIYLQPSPSGPAVTVYAPGNVTLLQVVAQTHTGGADVGLGTDYTVEFSPCTSMMFGFIHIRSLSDPIKAALSSVTPTCDQGTLASNCAYRGLSIKLASGDPIGVGLGSGYALDFGSTDARTPTLAFIHQTNMGGMLPDSYAHAICPLDYFSEPVKSQLLAKLQTKNAGANGIPPCGALMQDKPGTSQGNWYSAAVSQFGEGLAHLLALVHYNLDPSQAVVSAGTDLLPSTDFGAQIVYTPQASGFIDPDPSRIAPDGYVYCIQGQLSVGQQNGHVDVEMADAGTLKADYASGPCAAAPSLGAKTVTYQR